MWLGVCRKERERGACVDRDGGRRLCVVSVFFALRACVGGGMGCEPFRLRFVMGWDGFRVYGVGE